MTTHAMVLGLSIGQVLVLPIILILAGRIANGRIEGKVVSQVVLGLCIVEILLGLLCGIWLAAKAIAGNGSENFAALTLMIIGVAIFGAQLELNRAIGKLCRVAPSRGKSAAHSVAVVLVVITALVMLGGCVAS